MNHLVAIVAVATALTLSACGSSNDDSNPTAAPDTSASIDQGIAEGEPNPAIPSGPGNETSMPGPADDEPPRSSEPGGDTSTVAGFWDGSILDGDERYIVIEPNGLWIEYFRMYDGDVARNCFAYTETQTLTPEDPAANAYSLADGRLLTLATDVVGDTLAVDFDYENRSESWPAVVGRLPEDLPLCSDQ